MAGWHHDGVFRPKRCVVCGIEFIPKSGVNKFCSESCRGRWKYINGNASTEQQYQKISGSWERYFSRLQSKKDRRDQISVSELLILYRQQQGRCALSGVEMTCLLEKGKRIWTNASIDRIEAGGLYTLSNIQLVCTAVNLFRCDIPISQFVEWCRLVSNYKGDRYGAR